MAASGSTLAVWWERGEVLVGMRGGDRGWRGGLKWGPGLEGELSRASVTLTPRDGETLRLRPPRSSARSGLQGRRVEGLTGWVMGLEGHWRGGGADCDGAIKQHLLVCIVCCCDGGEAVQQLRWCSSGGRLYCLLLYGQVVCIILHVSKVYACRDACVCMKWVCITHMM